MDIWDLKYHFELAVRVSAPGATVRERGGEGWEAVAADGTVVGWAGGLDADAPLWAAPLFGFEARLDAGTPAVPVYRPLPDRPAVEPERVPAPSGWGPRPRGRSRAQAARGWNVARGLQRSSMSTGGRPIPADLRSVAWHLTFRDRTRTLRDSEVDEVLGRALEALEGELGVRRRTS